jgi:hypothetical protein
MMSSVLASVLVDLLLLIGVVVLNWIAAFVVFDRLRVKGSTQLAFTILEGALNFFTVATVVSFLIADLVRTVKHYWIDR